MLEFRILGPFEVLLDGEPVALSGNRQLIVMAQLLLERGSVVPVERLIDTVWDDNPPATARDQIQISISSLRRFLAAHGSSAHIATISPGYALRSGDDLLDLDEFTRAATAARAALQAARVTEAAEEFRGALGLWRGQALSNIGSRLLQRTAALLNERRVDLLEEYLEAQVSTGVSQHLLTELVSATQEHQLREHLRYLLMLALYRAGRRAEALAVYRDTYQILDSEVGIEPGTELKALHQAILDGSEHADLTLPGPLAPRAAPPIAVNAPPFPPAVPRLLPSAIADFVGRSAQVSRILAEHRDPAGGVTPMPITIIFGRGGAGKTTLAVHVAHLLAPLFPDGQLFARLQEGNRPLAPSKVLERFLRVLGVSGPTLPESVEQRAEVFRNLVANRAVLIVLDDVMTEQQIAPLLPAGSRCSVILTSRRRLTGLSATSRHEIDGFSDRSGAELAARIVGPERVAAELKAVIELCRLTGGLPLALRVAAARLAARPHLTFGSLVERMSDESRRLDQLEHSGLGVRASISLSYESLTPNAQRLLRRLALCDAPHFPAWIGAPLLETDAQQAENLIDELAEAYLLDVDTGSADESPHYRFHDITRPFAKERLLAEENAQDRRAALERLAGAWLFLTGTAHSTEYNGLLLPSSSASRWPLPDSLTRKLLRDPLSWLEQERLAILATIRQAAAAGLTEHCWDLALSSVALFEARSYYSDWQESHELALSTACAAGDLRGEAAMRYSLGSLQLFQQQNAEALSQLQTAQALFERLGDQHAAALAVRNIGLIRRRSGDLDEATARWEEALAVFRAVGDRTAEAYTLNTIAMVKTELGDFAMAHELLEEAAAICSQTGSRRVGAQVQHQLGEYYLNQEDLGNAEAAFRRSLALVLETGDKVGECYARLGLAKVDLRADRTEAAQPTLVELLELAESLNQRLVAYRVTIALAEAELRLGHLDLASRYADAAVEGCAEVGTTLLLPQALIIKGGVSLAAGDSQQATSAWLRAVSALSLIRSANADQLTTQLQARLSEVAEQVSERRR